MRRYTVRTFFGECAMLILCAVFLIPIYFLVVSSFKTQAEMLESPFGIPTSLDFSNYGIALEGINFSRHFWISVYITSISVVLIVVFGSMAAFTIARKTNRLTKILRNYFLIGFMVPLQTTMLPLFLIMRYLNLLNTKEGLIFLHSSDDDAFIGCDDPLAVGLLAKRLNLDMGFKIRAIFARRLGIGMGNAVRVAMPLNRIIHGANKL